MSNVQSRAVVLVSPDYPPHTGGVERYSWHLAGELCHRGFSVIVISSSMAGEPEQQTDERGVLIWRFPSVWPVPERMPVPLPMGRWKQLKARLKKYDTVSFIVQTNLYPLSVLACYFAKCIGSRCLVVIHGSNYVCLGNSIIDAIENKYEALLIKKQAMTGARFAAVSLASAAFTEKLGFNAEVIAYNAIDYTEIDSVSASDWMLRRHLGVPADTVVFTYLGRLIREKGVLQLTEAFRVLQKDLNVPLALLIVGDGPLMLELKSKCSRNTFLLGQRCHSEAIAILKQTDCFLLPSDSEGFPTTVLEASVSGAYVISSPFGGCREATELVGGMVMAGNTVEDIVSACKTFLSNREVLVQQAEDRRVLLRQTISWEKTTEILLQGLGIHG